MTQLTSLQIQVNQFFRQRSVSLEAQEAYSQVLKLPSVDIAVAQKIASLMSTASYSASGIGLLQQLHAMLPNDIRLAAQLCDWHLSAKDYNAAKSIAKGIVSKDNKHSFANHCLAYIAETEDELTQARRHYRIAERWLDVFRICIADGDLNGAREAEARMAAEQRLDKQYLLLMGWLHFRESNTVKALEYWSQQQGLKLDGNELMESLNNLHRFSGTATDFKELPVEARTAVEWLRNPDIFLFETVSNPVYRDALMSTYSVVSLLSSKMPAHTVKTKATLRAHIVYHVQEKNWTAALKMLEDIADDDLRAAVVRTGISHSIDNKNWQTAVEIASAHPTTVVSEGLYDFLCAVLYEAGCDASLVNVLETHPKPTTPHYHKLALASTRLAIANDSNRKDFTDWTKAIGYWAVALSDNEYWQQWGKTRSEVIAKDVTAEQISELREEIVPDYIKRYHLDQAVTKEGEVQKQHQYHAVLLKTEIEVSAAIRHMIRAADAQKVEVPSIIRRHISPLLLSSLGLSDIEGQIGTLLPKLKLSPHEAQLIRKAFSPLSSVHALMEAGEYRSALDQLRKLHLEQPNNTEIRDELLYALRQSASIDAAKGLWEDAITTSKEALQLVPLHTETEKTLVQAACGWAEQLMQQEQFQTVVDRLTTIRASLRQKHPEFDRSLAEALNRRGWQIGFETDPTRALQLAERALQYLPDHAAAANLAANVYHSRAFQHYENKRYQEAIENGQKAFKFEPDPSTVRILANSCIALKRWDDAEQWALKALELRSNSDNFHFVIHIKMQIALAMCEEGHYQVAINILNPLIELEYDEDEVRPHLMLSAVLTDYGAMLFNSNNGNRYQATNLWRRAVQLDPKNHVARENLRISGVRI